MDLAGSERTVKTNNTGKRLKETVKINSSLMTLGRCLETLRWNQEHPEGSGPSMGTETDTSRFSVSEVPTADSAFAILFPLPRFAFTRPGAGVRKARKYTAGP